MTSYIFRTRAAAVRFRPKREVRRAEKATELLQRITPITSYDTRRSITHLHGWFDWEAACFELIGEF
jgi:hypothetical protein